MNNKYTPEEQELIDELGTKGEANHNRRAELLLSKAGDLSFNAKLRADNTEAMQPNVKSFLEYFTYKTRDIKQFDSIASKLEIALEFHDKQLPVEEYEKLTLSEYNKILEVESLDPLYGKWLEEMSQNCNVPEFKDMNSKLQRSVHLIGKLKENALDVNNYRAGDLMMYMTEKSTTIRGRQNLLGHGGKLEETFLTKYLHAAPLYIDKSDPTKPKVNKSHINSLLESGEISVDEILLSNTFRIDPTKLVSKKQAALLEKANYGYRENGDKITWQEVMRERYELLSNELHEGQQVIPNKLQEVTKEKSIHTENLEKIKIEYAALGKESLTQDEEKRKVELEKLYNDINNQIGPLGELEEKYNSEILTIDSKRLGASHWLNPKNVLGGHKKWFEKNDFSDLSKKMYDATPDQKAMICSEFAARSIASTIDRLNSLTSSDLIEDGLIQEKTTVIKSPISARENFTNLHPERLVKILEESGCVEKVENKFLKEVIQLDNVEKSKLNNKEQDYTTKLPKKIYSLLQNSGTPEEFIKNASGAIDVYLQTSKVERDIIKDVQRKMLDSTFAEIYEKHYRKPEGTLDKISHACIKALEYCKLRTKDKDAKKGLDVMVKDIKNGINRAKQDKQERLSQDASQETYNLLREQAGLIRADLRPHISQAGDVSKNVTVESAAPGAINKPSPPGHAK